MLWILKLFPIVVCELNIMLKDTVITEFYPVTIETVSRYYFSRLDTIRQKYLKFESFSSKIKLS